MSESLRNVNCVQWVDIAPCNGYTVSQINPFQVECHHTIESFRYGYCLCHTEDTGNFKVWAACNHAPITCDQICDAQEEQISYEGAGVYILLMFFFSLIVFTVLKICMTMGNRIPFFRRMRERIHCCHDDFLNCCGKRIPISVEAWRKLQQIKDVERIECKSFSDFDDDLISESSAHCVICLDDYEKESKVIYLKCGHHFHYECGSKWLLEHKECPICRQYFKTARDQRLSNIQIEAKEIDLQSVA